MLGGSMTKFVDDHCSDTDGRVSSDGGQLAAASRQIVGRSVCLWYPLPALLLYAPICGALLGLLSGVCCRSCVLWRCRNASGTQLITAVHGTPRGPSHCMVY